MKSLKRMPAMFWIYSTLVALFGYWQYRYYEYLSWDLIIGIGLFLSGRNYLLLSPKEVKAMAETAFDMLGAPIFKPEDSRHRPEKPFAGVLVKGSEVAIGIAPEVVADGIEKGTATSPLGPNATRPGATGTRVVGGAAGVVVGEVANSSSPVVSGFCVAWLPPGLPDAKIPLSGQGMCLG